MTIQYIADLESQLIKDNWFLINSNDLSACYLYNNALGTITKLPCTIEQLDISNIAEQLPNLTAEDRLNYFNPQKYLE